MDIRQPDDPRFVGCYADDGYTHDAECVVYTGPVCSSHAPQARA